MRISILFVALVVGFAASASAQSLPDWAAPHKPASPTAAPQAVPDPPAEPTPVPLDGGLGLLALAGGAYAARRLRASS